ncbi:RHS repeat-associated core domain-containing protein [Streptomyces sp. NPDC016640]|uniref:RHS repeat-associated core domain-containing protein n=1 Tax=Streptomyces sp. NPDC016640 TaxID=3364969 RepID=UPI0036F5119B
MATDLIGTPTELIDETGDIAWRTRSTLWGTTAWSRDSSTYTPLRFPGQYYDPETGRYTSPDPLGLAPAPNPVAYVHNPHTVCDSSACRRTRTATARPSAGTPPKAMGRVSNAPPW